MKNLQYFEALDGTWPAAKILQKGPWTLRDGQGGGKRVCAATADSPVTDNDIAQAKADMIEMDQTPLFMIRDQEKALDELLQARGYGIIDPVTIYTCPAAQLTDVTLPRVTVFEIWEPLAITQEIWAQGGIGPDRVAVMQRVLGPKTSLLGRQNEKPAGAAFVAIHAGVAMVHAVEVLPHQRHQGMGRWIMRAAAFWAVKNGAHSLVVMCTDANIAANRLYSSLGMSVVGQYHYRHLPDWKELS